MRGIVYKEIYSLELLDEKETKQLIKWQYVRKFNSKKKKDESLTSKEYLLQTPKACKMFVKYGDKMEVGFGFAKKWDVFAADILLETTKSVKC